jgi:thioredoxin reductase (NADPH)
MGEKILTPEMEASLRESFSRLKEDVDVLVFTEEGVNEQYSRTISALIGEIADMEPRIRAGFHRIGDEASVRYDVRRSPTLLIRPEKYDIRFTGAPLGEEGRSLVASLIMASTGRGLISEGSRERLKRLSKKRRVRVFTSPT